MGVDILSETIEHVGEVLALRVIICWRRPDIFKVAKEDGEVLIFQDHLKTSKIQRVSVVHALLDEIVHGFLEAVIGVEAVLAKQTVTPYHGLAPALEDDIFFGILRKKNLPLLSHIFFNW